MGKSISLIYAQGIPKKAFGKHAGIVSAWVPIVHCSAERILCKSLAFSLKNSLQHIIAVAASVPPGCCIEHYNLITSSLTSKSKRKILNASSLKVVSKMMRRTRNFFFIHSDKKREEVLSLALGVRVLDLSIIFLFDMI